MTTIPESTGPRTPQEPPKPVKPKSKQRSDSLISSQRIKKDNILQKPERRVGKENLTPTREAETSQKTAKATSEMAKRVKKQGSFMGSIRGLLSGKKRAGIEAATFEGPKSAEAAQETAKATSEMVKRVKKQGSFMGTIRGLLPGKKKTQIEAAAVERSRPEGVNIAARKLMAELGKEQYLYSEGIFRVEGNNEETAKLVQNLLDAPEKTSPGIDVNNMTSALKRIFRDKKKGLINGEAADAFMKAGTNPSIEQLKACVSVMKTEDRALLQEFCQLAEKISDRSKVNKMTIDNIATSTARSIYQCTTVDPLSEVAIGNRVVGMLIRNQAKVFTG